MFSKLRTKTEKALLVRSIISSIMMGLSFLGSIICFFFHFLFFAVGHGGEVVWTLAGGITSLLVFLLSLFFFITVDKIRKGKARNIR